MKVFKGSDVIKNILPWFLALTLFMQGLYFDPLTLVAALVGLAMLFYVIHQNKTIILPKDKGFYFFILLFMVQLLGYVFFLEKGMLIFELLRTLMYGIYYLLVFQLKDEGFYSKFKMALVDCLAVGGVLSMTAYFFGFMPGLNYVINGRLAGPLQYANTNGILLLVGLIFLFESQRQWRFKIPLALLLLIPMLLTMSRSTMLFGLVVVICFFVWIKRDKATFIGILTSIIIGVIFIWLIDTGGAIERLGTSHFGVSEWQTRLLYYEDALGMIKERLLGYGPYGYYYVQRIFQTGSTYYVKYVHSSLIQYFLDYGILGGSLYIGFTVYVVFLRKMSKASWLAIITLIGHSFLDIDMAYSLIWLMIILLMQDGYEARKISIPLSVKKDHHYKAIFIGLAVLMIYGLLITVQYQRKDYKAAYILYPYYTEALRHDIGKTNSAEEDLLIAQRLVKQQPYILKPYKVLYNDAMIRGDYESGVLYARTLIKLNVLNIEYYEVLMQTLRILGEDALQKNNEMKAKEAFREILEMPKKLEQLAKEKKTHYNVKHVPSLTMTNEMIKHYLVADKWLETLKK